jgi:hypothetical protein
LFVFWTRGKEIARRKEITETRSRESKRTSISEHREQLAN